MKKIRFLLAFMLLSTTGLFAQGYWGYDSEELTYLKNGLYVLPTADQGFNEELAAALKKHWTFSEVIIVSQSEAASLLVDPTKCFIAPLDGLTKDDKRQVLSPRDSKLIDGLYIFRGEKRNKLKKIDVQLPILYSPFHFYKREDYHKKMDFAVKYFNDWSFFIIENKIKDRNRATGMPDPAIGSGIQKDPNLLKNKILLIDSLVVKMLTEEAIAEYKYKYEIVGTSQMIELMNSDPGKYCYLTCQSFQPRLQVFDVESCRLLYENGVLFGKKGKKMMFEQLNSAIEKD